jgi:predicted nucleic acid-binding protein
LDTNALVRLLVKDEPQQHRVVRRLLDEAEHPLTVADVALVETAFVLNRHYKLSRPTISHTFDVLAGLAKLRFDRELFQQAMELYIAHPSLAVEDCYLAAYAERYHVQPLQTFDKKLANQAPSATLLS